MGTKFAVVGSNLNVAYKEIELFALSPQAYRQDFFIAKLFYVFR